VAQGDDAPTTTHPLVSVIVVNYHGCTDTIACIQSLRNRLDYPRIEIVCVDNSSRESGEAAEIRSAAPESTVIEAGGNLGFAGGVNLGARHATGTVLALLNNDARPHADWVRAAIGTLRSEPTVAAVASKVLDWEGTTVDYVDAGLTWYGMGYKPHAGSVLDDVPETAHAIGKDVLFATGAAMFVRANVFAELDGFDERFFMFYEDVDLGWRLNLRGWRVRYAPDSVAYHRHHATFSARDAVESGRETFLLERNALATLYKNAAPETLGAALPGALALAVRRANARGDLTPDQLDPESSGAAVPETDAVSIPRNSLAGMLAIDQFVDLLPGLDRAREVEQAARVRTDADLWPLLRNAIEPAYPLPRYMAAHEILVKAFDIESHFSSHRRVLVITGDAVTERMAGPAIRAWNIAATLAAEHHVRLVTVNSTSAPPGAPFEITATRELDAPIEWADIIILQGHILEMAPTLRERHRHKVVVCDLYDPMHLELLEQRKDAPDDERGADLAGVTGVLDRQLLRGDFFLCASERQRHFWLGHLAALGRLSPTLYDADPSTRSLLAVAPFGLPQQPPRRDGPGPREKIAGIGEGDHVVLWAGGVYNWFDPLTLVRAVGLLSLRRPDVRLVFLGMRHPNPDVGEMDIGTATMELADSLGLTDEHVFFNEDWVPYEQRQNWLLDADCGVTTHFEHIETTFAFRTRVLDYLWSGLPVVTTDGDALADLVRSRGLGLVVPAEDTEALATALERTLYDTEFAEHCRERITEVAAHYTWPEALRPLLEFCRDPRPAADRLPGTAMLNPSGTPTGMARVRADLATARRYLAAGEPQALVRRARDRMTRTLRNRLGGW